MEERVGDSLGDVRVYTGPQAAAATQNREGIIGPSAVRVCDFGRNAPWRAGLLTRAIANGVFHPSSRVYREVNRPW